LIVTDMLDLFLYIMPQQLFSYSKNAVVSPAGLAVLGLLFPQEHTLCF